MCKGKKIGNLVPQVPEMTLALTFALTSALKLKSTKKRRQVDGLAGGERRGEEMDRGRQSEREEEASNS